MDPYSTYSWYSLLFFFLQREYSLLKFIDLRYVQADVFSRLCFAFVSSTFLSILFPRPFIYSFGWRNIFPALFLLCFLHTSPQTLYLSIWWKEYFLPLFSVLCSLTLSLQTSSPSCFLVLLSFLQRSSHYLVFNLFRCFVLSNHYLVFTRFFGFQLI